MKDTAKRLCTLFAAVALATGAGALVACSGDGEGLIVPPPTGETMSGVYYFATEDGAGYTLTMNGGAATLYADGELDAGTYTVTDNIVNFSFAKGGQLSARLDGTTLVLALDGEKTFYKSVRYNVEFDCGDAGKFTVPTVNGMTVDKPDAPALDGYAFLGWYADKECTAPFAFDGRILADTTVYARWGEKQVGDTEFKVSFDWNGAETPAPAAATTVGGKLYDLPTAPQNAGYEFGGWWVSMHNEADKLSFAYTPDYKFEENTTLFALWTPTELGSKLAAPLVNVGERSISWNGATGVSEYKIEVKNAQTGATVLPETSTGTTSVNSVSFAALPAGDYEVRVTAIASSADDNSDTTVRYYRNKALKRVSHIDVLDPALLVFGGVQYATEYELNITCGNPHHAHNAAALKNGSATSFSLANCDMRDSDDELRGITVTVTAKAADFAPSTSEVFVYIRELEAMGALKYDKASQTVMWNAVDKATNYFVSVNGGEYKDIGGATSFSLKEFAARDGKLKIEVYPATKGYLSPSAGTLECEKPALYTPHNIRFADGNTLCWDAVTGATAYDVKVGTSVKEVTGTSANLPELFSLSEGSKYEISVRSKDSGGESLYSDALAANYLSMSGLIWYENGTLNWTPVLGGDRMEVSVNDGEYVALDGYGSQAEVTLGRAGYNKLSVRFVKNEVPSRAMSLQVFAYTVAFDAQNGTAVSNTYKAAGDELALGDANKANYIFKGWYNVPGGAASNGALFDGKLTVTGDMRLYAYYQPKKFVVTYLFGTYGSGVTETQEVEYREDYKFIVPRTSEPTQMFGGWYTGDNGTGVALTNVNGECLAPWSIPADTKVYAYWMDNVLRFDKTRLPGTNEDVYRVSMGTNSRGEITIPATYNDMPVAVIGASAFEGSYVKVLNIPDTIQIISSEAFAKCSDLTAVNIYRVEGNNAIRYYSHEGVLYDYGALDDQPEDKTWLTSTLQFYPRGKECENYEVPDRVTTVASNAFEHVSSGKLKAVTFPTSVTYVATRAFNGHTELETITFANPRAGEQVQDLIISDTAFYGLSGLKVINFPARLKNLNVKTYRVEGLATGTPSAHAISYSGYDMPGSLCNLSSLREINVAAGGRYFSSEDGVLYNADKSTLLMFPIAKTPTYKDPTDAEAEEESGKFVVPTEVGKIGAGAFVMAKNITEIVLPALLTEIGECAFYGSSLEIATIEGNDLGTGMTIGRYAFRQCWDLAQFNVANNTQIKKIEMGAFMKCESLEAFTVPGSTTEIGDQVFRDCKKLATLNFKDSRNALKFGNFVFSGCTALATLTLPANATSVPSLGGIPLQNVVIAEGSAYLEAVDGVVYSKDKTVLYFYPNAKDGETFEIPSTVTRIAPSAFQGAAKLKSITIGGNITEIGDAAFKDCTALATITFVEDGSDLAVGSYAFAGCAATSLTVPARVKTIGDYAFADMEDLATFELKSALTKIPAGMLRGTAITEFTIKNTVTEIGNNAFLAAESLATVNIESGSRLARIGIGAFAGTAITEFALPDSVEIIDNQAFYYAESLATFTVNASSRLTTIGVAAFDHSAIQSVFIPKSVRNIMPRAFIYTDLTEVTFAMEGGDDLYIGSYVPNYVDYEDNEDYAQFGQVFGGTALTEVHLPARTVELGRETFYGCEDLETVTFAPAGQESKLMYIAEGLFDGCESLTSVTIPKSVGDRSPVSSSWYRYAIGTKAFADCVSLEAVVLEPGNTNTFTIAKQAFGEVSRWYGNAEIPGITEFTLPRNLDYIGSDAFAKCVNLQRYYIDGDKEDGNTNVMYGSFDGVLYTTDFSEVLLCPPAREGKVTLHDSVQRINAKAFTGCSAITELSVPANMAKLDVSKLSDCVGLNKISVKGEGLYKEVDGLLYNGDVTELLYVPATMFDGENVKSITLPASLSKIADNAFYNITGLKEISFANITKDFEIGDNAFYGCTGLTAVSLPASLTKLGKSAFEGCTNLATVEFADGCKLQEFGAFTFANCSSLQAIRIPAAVREIPELVAAKVLVWNRYWEEWEEEDRFGGIFYGCKSLASITFEQGSVCTSIGRFGFSVNPSFSKLGGSDEYSLLSPDDDIENNILTIELPQSITEIGEYAFYGCAKLTSVNLPAELLIIADGLFYYCESLASINAADGTNHLPANVSVIGDEAFYYCKKLTGLTLPVGVASIGKNAFYYCEALLSVNIPAATVAIGENTFEGCAALTDVDFAEGSRLAAIPESMFRGCTSLADIELPATVTALGDYAFYNTALTSFVLPESVVNIPNGLFYYCGSLSSVTLHESLASIGSNAFAESGIASINVPASVLSIGMYAFNNCKKLTAATINAAFAELPERLFEGCTLLATVTLPDTLTSIGARAFRGCAALNSVTFPNGLLSIGQQAFDGCTALTSVSLPESITTLGTAAFARSGLTAFTLPSKVTSVSSQLLYNCADLARLTLHGDVTEIGGYAFSGTALTSFALPEKVTTIADGTVNGETIYGMLSDCKQLRTVTLHDNVTSIGSYAFYGCTALSSVTVGAKVERVGEHAFEGCSALTDIDLKTSIKAIASRAFAGTGIASFEIPATVTSYASDAFADIENFTLTVSPNNQSYKIINGAMWSADGTTLYFFIGNIDEFVWDATTSVAEGAFNGLNIKKLTVKAGATVGTKAFYSVAIDEVLIEDAVTEGETVKKVTIGESAFEKTSIKTLTIGAGAVVGSYAFDAAKLGTVTIGAGAKLSGKYCFNNTKAYSTSVPMTLSFGDGTEITGDNAFKNSEVSEIVFGENVGILAYECFWYCNNVKQVFLPKSTICKCSYPFDEWSSDQVILLEATEEELAALISDGKWNANWLRYCNANVKNGQTKPAAPSQPENPPVEQPTQPEGEGENGN